jgi:hypothetical protein
MRPKRKLLQTPTPGMSRSIVQQPTRSMPGEKQNCSLQAAIVAQAIR